MGLTVKALPLRPVHLPAAAFTAVSRGLELRVAEFFLLQKHHSFRHQGRIVSLCFDFSASYFQFPLYYTKSVNPIGMCRMPEFSFFFLSGVIFFWQMTRRK